LHDGSEVRFSEVDVGLPTRERIWLPVVWLPTSVAVMLLDADDRVLLVQRYRFVHERWGWELPGGQVDEEEAPVEAAGRELEELTGYRAGELEQLITYEPLAEVVDGERIVFVGREPSLVGEPVGLGMGERAEWVALRSVPGLIADRQVWDGTSVLGLLSLLAEQR
jgi:8-oxo-dGDP phosphatase